MCVKMFNITKIWLVQVAGPSCRPKLRAKVAGEGTYVWDYSQYACPDTLCRMWNTSTLLAGNFGQQLWLATWAGNIGRQLWPAKNRLKIAAAGQIWQIGGRILSDFV